MPGALVLAHHLGDGAVLVDQVVAGDPGVRAAQQVAGGGSTRHACIVQQQHVRCPAIAPRFAVGGGHVALRQRRQDHAAISMMRS